VDARRRKIGCDVAVAFGCAWPILTAKFESVLAFRPTDGVSVCIKHGPVPVVGRTQLKQAREAAIEVVARNRVSGAARTNEDRIDLADCACVPRIWTA